ncbi:hypothetical protein P4203_24865 [Pseudomonas aeruginosa]|nr:hypothetical protein [Pseudomonas aeruginosa]
MTYSYDSRRLTAVTRSNGEGSLTRRYGKKGHGKKGTDLFFLL